MPIPTVPAAEARDAVDGARVVVNVERSGFNIEVGVGVGDLTKETFACNALFSI